MVNINEILNAAERDCADVFAKIDQTEFINTRRILDAFTAHGVSYRHFAQTTGYGYDDIGRDTYSEILADIFGCEKAVARPQIASGTHVLAICLYGMLRPNDTLLAAAGKPYDTLEQVIGISGEKGSGSLADYGVNYKQVELKGGRLDFESILNAITPDVRLVLVQRSRGYDWRPSLFADDINALVEAVHKKSAYAKVMVDNCYGEFTDTCEPKADILAGSLIKNPGGGLAPTGGYFAGSAECVDLISNRLTSPGIGAEVGSYAGGYQPFYQGLFMAPHAVAQALKTSCLCARACEIMGFETHPRFDDRRGDIIQAIRFGDEDKLIRFIQAIQRRSPIDSMAVPMPWDMPGYTDRVIMAAGTFVSGASIELSADAPIRDPYIAYLQGGLTYALGKLALYEALSEISNNM